MENTENKVDSPRTNGLRFYTLFFTDVTEEMMRITYCFVILFLINNKVHFAYIVQSPLNTCCFGVFS